MPGGRPTGLLPSGVATLRGDAPGVAGNCMGRAGESAIPMSGIPAGTGNGDEMLDMGGAIGIDMGIDPGAPPIMGIFAFCIGIAGDCKAGEGEPNAAGDPAVKAAFADKAGDAATPAEPSLAREDGSGLCEAPSPAANLEAIIL